MIFSNKPFGRIYIALFLEFFRLLELLGKRCNLLESFLNASSKANFWQQDGSFLQKLFPEKGSLTFRCRVKKAKFLGCGKALLLFAFGVIHPSIIFGVQFCTKVRGRGFLLRFPKCTYFDWKISHTCVPYSTKLGHKKNKSNF